MQATRFAAPGRSTSNWRNDGDAWTQRLTSITFEKIATTPSDPAGTRGGGLLHDDVRVDAAAGRLGRLELAEGVAIPAHRDPAVEPDPLGHPLARDGVAERPDPRLRDRSAGASVTTVSCQKLPPTRVTGRAGRRRSRPGRAACRLRRRRPACPAARPVSSAARPVSGPTTVPARGPPGRSTGRAPRARAGPGDQVRAPEVEQVGARAARSGRSRSGRSAGRGPSR